MTSWLEHIKGSLSLLKLRGDQQLETNIGRRLFVQLRSFIVNQYPKLFILELTENR
jgi:uncharacterized protein Veg